jgi:hypothetical protein
MKVQAEGMGKWSSTANAPASLTATAFNSSVFKGDAVGFARDPYQVAAGTYEYNPVLGGSFKLSNSVGFLSGVSLSAVGDGITQDGEPLWSLSIVFPPGGGDLNHLVSFQSDPVLGLDDASIKSSLISALDTTTPNVIEFKALFQSSDYSLFDTTFTASSSFLFGETVIAEVSSVPEPCSLVISSIGALLLLGLYTSRRGRIVGQVSCRSRSEPAGR